MKFFLFFCLFDCLCICSIWNNLCSEIWKGFFFFFLPNFLNQDTAPVSNIETLNSQRLKQHIFWGIWLIMWVQQLLHPCHHHELLWQRLSILKGNALIRWKPSVYYLSLSTQQEFSFIHDLYVSVIQTGLPTRPCAVHTGAHFSEYCAWEAPELDIFKVLCSAWREYEEWLMTMSLSYCLRWGYLTSGCISYSCWMKPCTSVWAAEGRDSIWQRCCGNESGFTTPPVFLHLTMQSFLFHTAGRWFVANISHISLQHFPLTLQLSRRLSLHHLTLFSLCLFTWSTQF